MRIYPENGGNFNVKKKLAVVVYSNMTRGGQGPDVKNFGWRSKGVGSLDSFEFDTNDAVLTVDYPVSADSKSEVTEVDRKVGEAVKGVGFNVDSVERSPGSSSKFPRHTSVIRVDAALDIKKICGDLTNSVNLVVSGTVVGNYEILDDITCFKIRAGGHEALTKFLGTCPLMRCVFINNQSVVLKGDILYADLIQLVEDFLKRNARTFLFPSRWVDEGGDAVDPDEGKSVPVNNKIVLQGVPPNLADYDVSRFVEIIFNKAGGASQGPSELVEVKRGKQTRDGVDTLLRKVLLVYSSDRVPSFLLEKVPEFSTKINKKTEIVFFKPYRERDSEVFYGVTPKPPVAEPSTSVGILGNGQPEPPPAQELEEIIFQDGSAHHVFSSGAVLFRELWPGFPQIDQTVVVYNFIKSQVGSVHAAEVGGRLEILVGDPSLKYFYSTKRTYEAIAWKEAPGILQLLRDHVSKSYNCLFNCAFIVAYESGAIGLNKHIDGFPLGRETPHTNNSCIANAVFGDKWDSYRDIQFPDYHKKISTHHGIIYGWKINDKIAHQVAKADNKDIRIVATFRNLTYPKKRVNIKGGSPPAKLTKSKTEGRGGEWHVRGSSQVP